MAMQASALNEPRWTLGDRLRKARQSARVERDEMAERMGVSPAAISHWEGDRRRPTDLLGMIEKWANETGVPAQWLLGYGSTSERYLTDPPPALALVPAVT